MERSLGNLVVVGMLAAAGWFLHAQWEEGRPACERGRAAMSAGDYETAAAWLERARTEDPADMSVSLSLAECYDKLGRKDSAVQAYRRVEGVLLEPSNSVTLQRHKQRFSTLRAEGY